MNDSLTMPTSIIPSFPGAKSEVESDLVRILMQVRMSEGQNPHAGENVGGMGGAGE